MKNSIIPIFIPHLGCPHKCVFCDQKSIAAPHAPSPEEVTSAIETGLTYSLRPQVAFYGGSFTAISQKLQDQYLNAAAVFLDSGRIDSIRISTRPDCIDEDTVMRLKSYGVKTIELGAQSMFDDVLSASGRGHTAEDTVRASKIIKSCGVELILQIMAGMPESDRYKDVGTAKMICNLSPDAVRIYPMCVVEGTELFDMYKSGAYTPLSVEDATDICADMLEIFDACNIPVVRIGLNPSENLHEAVAAGAYHPALGELVRSRVLLRKIEKLIVPGCKKAVISVKKGRISMARGQKNCNFKHLSSLFPKVSFEFAECQDQTEDLLVTCL